MLGVMLPDDFSHMLKLVGLWQSGDFLWHADPQPTIWSTRHCYNENRAWAGALRPDSDVWAELGSKPFQMRPALCLSLDPHLVEHLLISGVHCLDGESEGGREPVQHAGRVNRALSEGVETPDAFVDILEPEQSNDLGLAQALRHHCFGDQGLKCVHAVPYGKTPSMAIIYLDFNGVALRYLGIAVARPVPKRGRYHRVKDSSCRGAG
jgi:hypothetical protein